MDHDYSKLFVEETSLYELGSLVPERLWSPLPHFFRGWLRNYIGGVFLKNKRCRLASIPYLVNVSAYLVFVEFGIYWMHRELHNIKPLYKWLHATHHIYNKQNTLSPFADLAFHPLDGILQALSHVVALFLVLMHFRTHIIFHFMEGIRTANIHDCINGKIWPVMGAGYHTIHHTTYRHNYGHYTIWMDWMFGTLHNPDEDEAKKV
ncbi:hypothetical protein ACH5RR_011690 [Cinchona calisaya]|uniref:Fatty acid hydroxylase domain-containing protein n=1 Tax=Cinchona calisaya TaxID=153742 RepID=A0ABD3A5R3_9GENT